MPPQENSKKAAKLLIHMAGVVVFSAEVSNSGSQGMGVFPVTALGAADLAAVRGLRLLGQSENLHEEIHAIRSRRGLHHPLVLRILAAAHAAQA